MRARTTVVVVLAALLVAGFSGVALAEVLTGNNRPNVLIGTGQDDILSGKGANDTMCGGRGNDTYSGGKGNDAMTESCITGSLSGNDTMNGGPGTDFIFGEEGNDRIDAGAGNDIVGAARFPIPLVFGNDGNDHIRGGKGNDGLIGENGRDELYGEDGDDLLDGISESVPMPDLLDGGRGRDICVADDLDTVLRCEEIIRPSASSRQAQADPAAIEARAREAFAARYGTSD